MKTCAQHASQKMIAIMSHVLFIIRCDKNGDVSHYFMYIAGHDDMHMHLHLRCKAMEGMFCHMSHDRQGCKRVVNLISTLLYNWSPTYERIS